MLLTRIRLPKLRPAWLATQGHKPEMKPENYAEFDVVGDGKFRTCKVNRYEVASYKGPMSYLMFRPSLKPEQAGWVKVRRIRLGK